MYSALACAFIAAAFGGAVYLCERPTVARGEVLAAQVRTLDPGGTEVRCDDAPIHPDGAEFSCTSSDARFACSLDREGKLQCRAIDTRHAGARDADPAW
jgi:hypothetical protein